MIKVKDCETTIQIKAKNFNIFIKKLSELLLQLEKIPL